ncbi:MAG: MBL fold metallo-hydrolase [Bacteroidota bacterium]|nr:MBL fold metallo-hydrolase [Bacteroidota bacterium]
MTVTLLGTGTSTGVPIIGCSCSTCVSTDPRDRRLRTSCYVQVNDLSIVIDTGPDFRQQMLHHRITHIDAVLWTHHHFDHIVGLDDLRPFCFHLAASMPCYTHPHSAKVLKDMFRYAFAGGRKYANVPRLALSAETRPFRVTSRGMSDAAVRVVPVEVAHGSLRINGYRIGNFAYLTDTSHIPERGFNDLAGIEVFVLNALRQSPHPKHFSISEAVEMAHRVGARQTIFTHLTHDILHQRDIASLPDGMTLGYDGMTLEVEDA